MPHLEAPQPAAAPGSCHELQRLAIQVVSLQQRGSYRQVEGAGLAQLDPMLFMHELGHKLDKCLGTMCIKHGQTVPSD